MVCQNLQGYRRNPDIEVLIIITEKKKKTVRCMTAGSIGIHADALPPRYEMRSS